MKTSSGRGTYGLKALAVALAFPAFGSISTMVGAEPVSTPTSQSRSFDGNVHRKAGIMDVYSCDGCHAEVIAARSWSADASSDYYKSSTMDAAVGPPDGTSRWCLQCHDGAIASDGGTPAPSISVTNSHPVSFVYDDALAQRDGGLFSPSMPSPLGGSIASDLLENGKMQCSSCHDFHSERPKLVKTERQSTLCLACHDK